MVVTVYVESNYLLEIALQQDETALAEMFLDLAEQQSIQLRLPDSCLGEAYSTIGRRRQERERLIEGLRQEWRQISRSTTHFQLASTLEQATRLLPVLYSEQLDRLEVVLSRVLALGPLIATNYQTYQESLKYQQRHLLRAQDALIYASVISDLRAIRLVFSQDQTVFVTRNTKDFDVPSIKTELATYACRLIGSFAGGLQYVRSVLPAG